MFLWFHSSDMSLLPRVCWELYSWKDHGWEYYFSLTYIVLGIELGNHGGEGGWSSPAPQPLL